ncbi:hypothetical protein QQF64_033900 [Cirrhinus molitorella]|uniref:SAP domain-containing protein n=1 Tax=Cirrhinus molitorella TaxID=172907 RepID=A0ABR3MVA6_9TELE
MRYIQLQTRSSTSFRTAATELEVRGGAINNEISMAERTTHITIQNGDALPELQQCNKCCSNYHCSFCAASLFKPTKLVKLNSIFKATLPRQLSVETSNFSRNFISTYCSIDHTSRERDTISNQCSADHTISNYHNIDHAISDHTISNHYTTECTSSLLRKGGAKNPFAVKPTHHFWAPRIGKNTRRSDSVLNTEYEKLHSSKSASETAEITVTEERLKEELQKQKVNVIRKLCKECGLDSTRSRSDLLLRLSNEIKSRQTYDKIFEKIWGASEDCDISIDEPVPTDIEMEDVTPTSMMVPTSSKC